MAMTMPSPSAPFRFALPLTLLWALFRLGASVPRVRHFHPLVTHLPPTVQLHVLRHLNRSDRNSFAMAFPWWCWLVHAHSNELPDYPNQAERERTEKEARDKRRRLLRRWLLPIFDLSEFLKEAMMEHFDWIVDALSFCRNTGLFIHHFWLLTPADALSASTNLAPFRRLLCLLLCGPSSSIVVSLSDNHWSFGHCWLLLQYVYFAITLSECAITLIFSLLHGPLLPPNPEPDSFGTPLHLFSISSDIVFYSVQAVTLISNNPWYPFFLFLVSNVCDLVSEWKEFPVYYVLDVILM